MTQVNNDLNVAASKEAAWLAHEEAATNDVNFNQEINALEAIYAAATTDEARQTAQEVITAADKKHESYVDALFDKYRKLAGF